MVKRLVLTSDEVARRQAQAVEFMERLGNEDKADELDELSPTEYAERRGITIQNPRRRIKEMVEESKADLLLRLAALNEEVESLEEENAELAEQNDSLNDTLNRIFTMASPDDDLDDDQDAEIDEVDENEDETDK
jgi:galactokinase